MGLLDESEEGQMSHRCLAAVFVLIAVVALTAHPVVAQTAPRTPWGHPDLQGVWNNGTITPMQRPEEQADKEFLTEGEAANLEQTRIARNERLLNRPAQRTTVTNSVDRGEDGAPGFYNNLWLDYGTTTTGRTSIVIDPPNGRLPALTPEAHTRRTSPEAQRLRDVGGGRSPAASWEDLPLAVRCIWYRGIPSLPSGYNNHYHIVQTPEWVAILQEHIHEVRYIPLDGRPHIAPAIRQYAGDSRGHWEGETLVVETTNFRNETIIRQVTGGTGDLSEALHVVERYTRIGPDTLDWEFTVTDPKTWTSPWTGSLPMTRTQAPMFEYACHEGNYGLYNILTGSRAKEKAAAQAAKE